MSKKIIELTMSKKQLEQIVFTMGVALETDSKPMNEISGKKFEKIAILHDELKYTLNQMK
jgi:hypothetical protein